MPLSEARMVRDELAKLVLDMLKMKNIEDQVIEVKLKGGSFK
jgi:hypothetical protein